jgi:hypothetical protein
VGRGRLKVSGMNISVALGWLWAARAACRASRIQECNIAQSGSGRDRLRLLDCTGSSISHPYPSPLAPCTPCRCLYPEQFESLTMSRIVSFLKKPPRSHTPHTSPTQHASARNTRSRHGDTDTVAGTRRPRRQEIRCTASAQHVVLSRSMRAKLRDETSDAMREE